MLDEQVYIAGLAYDYCVGYTALGEMCTVAGVGFRVEYLWITDQGSEFRVEFRVLVVGISVESRP